jgi:hypothetical protein
MIVIIFNSLRRISVHSILEVLSSNTSSVVTKKMWEISLISYLLKKSEFKHFISKKVRKPNAHKVLF